MSGRYEKEIKIDTKVREQLEKLPPIISDYYYSLVSSGKSYVTAKSYVYNVAKFLEATFKKPYKKDFYRSVGANEINRYMASLRMGTRGKRKSDSYMTTNWSALNSFFDFLVPTYITVNPVSLTKRPKQKDNPDVAFLTEEEIAMVLENVKSRAPQRIYNRDLAILKLGFTTGLRVSEIVQIDLNDVDFVNNKINITGKGDKDYSVIMGENLKKQILIWLDDRKKYFSKTKSNALFISQEYNRLSTRSVNDLIKRYGEGINKRITPHVMRHTMATITYNKTDDIYLVSSMLHHSNISTTMRYAAMSNERQQKASKLLDDLI